MVLSFKFNLNQTRKFHTFHFKFKRLIFSCQPPRSAPFRRLIEEKQPNFLSRTASKNTLFNIGNQFCRMSSSINPIVIEPSSTHKSTVSWSLGFGTVVIAIFRMLAVRFERSFWSLWFRSNSLFSFQPLQLFFFHGLGTMISSNSKPKLVI